jgi:hypothetical protein
MAVELTDQYKQKRWAKLNALLIARIENCQMAKVKCAEEIAKMKFDRTHPLFRDSVELECKIGHCEMMFKECEKEIADLTLRLDAAFDKEDDKELKNFVLQLICVCLMS